MVANVHLVVVVVVVVWGWKGRGGLFSWGAFFQVGGMSKFLAGGGDFFLFFC